MLRLRVISNSMWPMLRAGDGVVTRAIDPADLQRGDVIVVQHAEEWITHRLISVEADGYQTHGDNTLDADQPMVHDQIVGQVIAIERGGQTIDLQRRRWRIANRALGVIGWLQIATLRRARRLNGGSSSKWRSIGAGGLAWPFRALGRLIVFVSSWR